MMMMMMIWLLSNRIVLSGMEPADVGCFRAVFASCTAAAAAQFTSLLFFAAAEAPSYSQVVS